MGAKPARESPPSHVAPVFDVCGTQADRVALSPASSVNLLGITVPVMTTISSIKGECGPWGQGLFGGLVPGRGPGCPSREGPCNPKSRGWGPGSPNLCLHFCPMGIWEHETVPSGLGAGGSWRRSPAVTPIL